MRGEVNADAVSRMFMGALLTYAILDGLLVGEGPPRPPKPEQIEAEVDLFMKTISSQCPNPKCLEAIS